MLQKVLACFDEKKPLEIQLAKFMEQMIKTELEQERKAAAAQQVSSLVDGVKKLPKTLRP